MKIIYVLCAVALFACANPGQPNRESSSQDEAKGALDEPGFFRRMVGEEAVEEEPDLTLPKKDEEDDQPGKAKK